MIKVYLWLFFGKAKSNIKHTRVPSNRLANMVMLENMDLPMYILPNERSLMQSSILPVNEWVTPPQNLS
jgi:hypothetical protein